MSHSKKVLIIDDDPSMLTLYKKILEYGHFDVTLADSGKDGLKKAASLHPDVILLDMMMPNMNGIEVLEKLKAAKTTKSIPVIVLSNLAGEQYMKSSREKGAESYAVKSDYDPDELVAIIEKSLASRTAAS